MSEAEEDGAPTTLRRREQDPDVGGARPPEATAPLPPWAAAMFAKPPPLYTGHNVRPAHALRYDWTGWPTSDTALPPGAGDTARATTSAWETDGLRLLELRAKPDAIQILFSVTPHVSPVFFCQRVKGRLQHALRQAGTPATFSRKVAFRSLGENTSGIVANYIRGQTDKEDLADSRYRELLRQFTVQCADVRLAEPTETNSGRYWYNLHVVLVMAGRFRITNPAKLAAMRDAAFAVAKAEGHAMASVSLMPDHVHASIRGNIARSPEEIALAFQNGLARAAGCRMWQDGYYVGSFSEYDLDVVRRLADARTGRGARHERLFSSVPACRRTPARRCPAALPSRFSRMSGIRPLQTASGFGRPRNQPVIALSAENRH